MLRPGSHASATKPLLDSDTHADPWPRFLRGGRSFAVPGRVLAAFVFVLIASFALHCWVYGRMHALEAQLARVSTPPPPPSTAQGAAAAAVQLRLLVDQITASAAKQSQSSSSVEAKEDRATAVALPLPPPPPPVVLTSFEIGRLEDPWRWFESSGEHADLLAKVQALRKERGRPLVLLDIGLNIGSAPWAIARICPDCTIYGFEPIPQYFAFARLKLPPSAYPNVHLFNYAICDHVGEETIWMDPGSNVGWNTMIGDEKSASQVAVRVQCVTIDSLVAARLLPPTMDLIKIDTEGAEHMVLTGMKQTIVAHPLPKPWMYVEVGWGVARKDWQDELAAFQILFDNGYESYDMSAISGTSMHWMTPKGMQLPDSRTRRQLKAIT